MTGQLAASKRTTAPPVTELGVGALICTVAAGVIVAAQVPNADTLWPAIVLLVAAAVLLGAAVVLMARIESFAWHRFFQVWQWEMLAYIVIAGMIEFVFIKDNTPGRILALLTLLLIAFALTVPLLMAFTVARYATVEEQR